MFAAPGWATDPTTLPLLRERATDPDDDVRWVAVEAIAALDHAEKTALA
jgi:HEAT repeat protein